jgi:hypothetical protein
MFTRGKNRLGAVVALVAVLAVVLAAPAGAADRASRGEERNWVRGLAQRVLVWLGVAPSAGVVVKCDQGSSIDPNGCPKATGEQGSQIDPNGRH